MRERECCTVRSTYAPRYSLKVPLSKKPDTYVPSGCVVPPNMWRGLYGVLEGVKSTNRVIVESTISVCCVV